MSYKLKIRSSIYIISRHRESMKRRYIVDCYLVLARSQTCNFYLEFHSSEILEIV